MLYVQGEALFQTHENLEHLAMMERVLGPLPQHMLKKAEYVPMAYTWVVILVCKLENIYLIPLLFIQPECW